jgi:hypothetical protein
MGWQLYSFIYPIEKWEKKSLTFQVGLIKVFKQDYDASAIGAYVSSNLAKINRLSAIIQ